MPIIKEGAPIEGTGPESLRDAGVTLVHTFFGEVKRLEQLRKTWASWPEVVKDNIKIIIVDDHGTPSIEELISLEEARAANMNLSIYRIQDDLKNNAPGALNLGCMAAATPWILTMDSDNSFDADTIQRLLEFRPEHDRFYMFYRHRTTNVTGEPGANKVIPCTILLHKDLFLEANGFDEDLAGEWSVKYTHGGLPGYALWDHALVARLIDEFRHTKVIQDGYVAMEWMSDVVGPHVESNYWDVRLNRSVWRKKQRGELPFSTDMLRFKWKRVLNNIRSK